MDKALSLFQHQFNTKPKKQRSPLLYPLFSRTRARITRTHYTIIPRFLPSLPSPLTEKHLATAWFAFTIFAFQLHVFTIFLHLCLHPYSPDFQPLSPIGEGVKAICTHYYSVYARARERGNENKEKRKVDKEKRGKRQKNCLPPLSEKAPTHRSTPMA